MLSQEERRQVTSERTRLGGLPAPGVGHERRLETGDGRPCDGCKQTIAPNEMASVIGLADLRTQFHDGCYEAWSAGIPAHSLKVGVEVAILKNLWVGGDVIAASSSFLRGDDANRQRKLDSYAILNLNARYEPIKHVELSARLDNVTNTEYETAGALNFNAFADPIAVERFVAPGPPFAGYGGVRVRL